MGNLAHAINVGEIGDFSLSGYRGYEPLVMASAVHVGADHAASSHTASGARLAYMLLTAAEWEQVQKNRAAANLPPAPK